MAIAEHWVASTRGLDRSLVEEQRAAWLWERLRTALPDAYSCVFMPDHIHMVLPPGRSVRCHRVLGAFTARFGVRFDLLPSERANSTAIAQRMIRYGFYNPVRAGMVTDPWQWRWSTLWDLAGATYPVWTPISEIARMLRLSPKSTLTLLTKTADKTASAPRTAPVVVATITGLRAAAASAQRIPYSETLATPRRRRLLVQLCKRVGASSMTKLAAPLGLAVSSVYDRRNRVPHPALEAAVLCLSDPRLLGAALPGALAEGR